MERLEDEKSKNPIQVADRIFQVLESLARGGPAGLMELSNTLGLHKSTVHRLLNSLIYMGYVRQDEETSHYALTFKILELADLMLNNMDVLTLVHPYLKKLKTLTGETVHFVQIEGAHAVYIAKEESHTNSIRMVSRVGSQIPLYRSGVGKALLAMMDDSQVRRIWEASDIQAVTSHTIVSLDRLYQVLEEIRQRGYALDDEENEMGVRCIAAAVPDYRGRPVYAFSISAPASRMTDERIPQLAEYVLQTREELAATLGYRQPS